MLRIIFLRSSCSLIFVQRSFWVQQNHQGRNRWVHRRWLHWRTGDENHPGSKHQKCCSNSLLRASSVHGRWLFSCKCASLLLQMRLIWQEGKTKGLSVRRVCVCPFATSHRETIG